MLSITSLRLDHGSWEDSPRGQITDSPAPSFDWAAVSDSKNDGQTAYRATVKQAESLLWDSGWVESEEQTCTYSGLPLPADCPLDFSVQIRNRAGEQSEPLSRTFYYVTCNFEHTWIADPTINDDTDPAPVSCFVKDVVIDRSIERATLYACGIGYHQVTVNGKAVDEALLDPAISDYTKRCYMAVHPDVAPLLQEGTNRLQIAVAGGWRRLEDGGYVRCYDKETKSYPYFFGPSALTAALHIVYTDSKEVWVHTDDTWRCTDHSCVRAQLFGGETYDARVKGESPREVQVVPGPGGDLAVMTLPPVMTHEVYTPISVACLAPATHVVDFGQNIAGVCRLKLPASLTAGQRVVLTHTEEIGADGDLCFDTTRKAANRDEYIAAGDGTDLQVWQPAFTYHGFRYVRVEGLAHVKAEDITACCLRTAIANTGLFRSGSALLNAVHQTVVHTEQDNMMSLLTDCPQRDERMGWLNDATVRFEETPYNFDIGRMFKKVLTDIRDQQSAADGSITCTAPFVFGSRPADPVCSSYLILGEQSYLFAGNRELLQSTYEGFARWEDCLAALAEDHIVNYTCYGDWAGPVYACVNGDKTIDATQSLYTPNTFMSTGYYYYNACLLAKFARWLGEDSACDRYTELAAQIKTAILNKWWDADRAVICTGSQGCQSFALWLGLIPPEHCQAAAARIHEDLVARDYHITTANLTTRYLMDALSRYGYEDDAYRLLTREDYPSIGYMLQQEATTVWERWELKKEPEMNSHNHPMYGAVDNWMYAYAAGIRPVDIAFRRVQIQPVYPTGLQSVCATLQTVKGELTVRWIRRFGQTELRVIVPFGVTADITVGDRVETVGSGFWTYTF